MIAYLKGILIEKKSTEVIILCSSVGYQVNISVRCYEKLPPQGSEASLHTILIPREDSFNLYGFVEIQEREMFKLLISISGIGPKSALGILSGVSPDVLVNYLTTNNLGMLQKLPGIGKKTAERIVVELKDKINSITVSSDGLNSSFGNILANEAVLALISLGYPKSTAEKAVKLALSDTNSSNESVEVIIRKALKFAVN